MERAELMGEYRKRIAAQTKKRISRRQKRKIVCLTGVLAVFLLLLGILFLTQKKEQEIGKQNLTVKQLCSFMSFYEYDPQQWYQYMLKLGMQKYVNWREMESFLQSIGVKEYLTYQSPEEDRFMTYGEFLELYEQMLPLLDGEEKVQLEKMDIGTITEAQDEWDSGMVSVNEEEYQVLTAIRQFQEGMSYSVYVLDQKILGIVKVWKDPTTDLPKSFRDSSCNDEDRVTVLLKNGNTAYRDKVYLLLEGDYTKTTVKGTQKILKDGHLLRLTNCEEKNDPKEDQYLLLEPQETSCRIYFADRSGNRLSEGYRGNFRIYRYRKGYVVVNELSIREYLYGVVPSEMPASYEPEALKAQAVCARSYTYQHISQKGMAGFYADLDDSVKYQVYNKSGDQKSTRKAVEETKNEILTYGGRTAVTYYYSTSCGTTQAYDLWGLQKEEFGYLRAKAVKQDGGLLKTDLSEEEAFRSFMDLDSGDFYEKDCRYFRWKATMNIKEQAGNLREAVLRRKKDAEDSIIITKEDGKETSDLSSLGNPLKLSVKKRSSGGGISSLLILYEKGSVELCTEYTIRSCLGACEPDIKLSDGETISPELIPSACFYVSSQKNGKIILRGGGFGHGLGMSQNGADRLAASGWKYKDILQFFYHGVELVKTEQ